MNILKEIIGCACFILLMALIVVGGSLLAPPQPGVHSEEALQPDYLSQLAESQP